MGAPGLGLDFDVGMSERFSARVGYSGYSISRPVNASDATYAGTLKLSMLSSLVDWYAFKGGFHLTAGIVGNGTKIDVTGRPAAGGVYTGVRPTHSHGRSLTKFYFVAPAHRAGTAERLSGRRVNNMHGPVLRISVC